jgi:hypothetical protein
MSEKPEYKRKPNGLAEDLGAVIGFSNTLLICGIRGGKTLYIPETAVPGHLLETLIGAAAFGKLVAEWGGETLNIPALADFTRYQRIRRCAQMLVDGKSLHTIARVNGVTYNQTKNDRRTAELLGMLPLVFSGARKVASDARVIEQLGFDGF